MLNADSWATSAGDGRARMRPITRRRSADRRGSGASASWPRNGPSPTTTLRSAPCSTEPVTTSVDPALDARYSGTVSGGAIAGGWPGPRTTHQAPAPAGSSNTATDRTVSIVRGSPRTSGAASITAVSRPATQTTTGTPTHAGTATG